jgi:hypothetical protein
MSYSRIMKTVLMALLSTLLLALTACGAKDTSSEGGSGSSSSKNKNPEVGKTSEDAFYVRLYDEGKFPFYMSQKSDFTKECKIEKDDANQTMECSLELNELDLFYWGFTLQHNFPSSMCSYRRILPYWYYNYEIGVGPSTFDIAVTKNEDGEVLSSSCTIDSVATCSGAEGYYDFGTSSAKCTYDHTLGGGPNCCFGSYSITTTTTNIGPGGGTSVSYSSGIWGGNILSCIGGPGKADWSLHAESPYSYPLGEVKYIAGTGENDVKKFKAPIANKVSNFSLANFYTPAYHTHTGYTIVGTSTSLPYFMYPIDDRNGSAVGSSNPAYLYQCLDKNYEIAYEIKLYVREWNTYEEFIKYTTSAAGESGDPDVGGNEGTGCDYYGSGDTCNDSADADESYLRGPYTSSNRRSYFPSQKYAQ